MRSELRVPAWTAACFAAAEIALRLYGFGPGAVLLPWHFTATRLFNTDLVIEDPDPGIGWRLRPAARSFYLGASFSTNQYGFREREVSLEPAPGVLRIAALGASIQMGAGVADEEVYTRRIQDRLEQRWPGRFNVLNFAVGAYRGPQMARAYEKYVARFRPRLVLIPVYESEFREFVADPPAPLPADRLRITNLPALLSRFYLYGALREGFARLARGRLSLDWAARARELRGAPPVRQLQTLQVLEEFTAARSREGVDVVLTILPELEGGSAQTRARFALELRRWAAARPGVKVVDCTALAGSIGSNDRVYFGDKHPNARVHDLYAGAIYEALAPLLTAAAAGAPSAVLRELVLR